MKSIQKSVECFASERIGALTFIGRLCIYLRGKGGRTFTQQLQVHEKHEGLFTQDISFSGLVLPVASIDEALDYMG